MFTLMVKAALTIATLGLNQVQFRVIFFARFARLEISHDWKFARLGKWLIWKMHDWEYELKVCTIPSFFWFNFEDLKQKFYYN